MITKVERIHRARRMRQRCHSSPVLHTQPTAVAHAHRNAAMCKLDAPMLIARLSVALFQVIISSEAGLIDSLSQMLCHTEPYAHSAAAGAIRNLAECTDTHAAMLACPDTLNGLSGLICVDLTGATFEGRSNCNGEGEEQAAKVDAKVYALGAVGNLAQSPLGAGIKAYFWPIHSTVLEQLDAWQ